MASNTATLVFAADTKQLDSAFKRVQGGAGTTEKRFGKLRAGAKLAAGVFLGGMAIAIKNGVRGASDLNESINKTSATFRKSGSDVLEWSKKANEAFGLTRTEALEGASSIGAMLGPMGIADAKASNMSRAMVQLAADMGSFNNQDPSEMLDRIRAGLSGESEPLRRFGSNLSDARVKAFAYSHGIAAVGEELTDAQKVQARYGLLLKDTKRQQGDFARTADQGANAQRVLSARWADAQTQLAGALLPAFTALVNILSDAVAWLTEHKTITTVVVSVLGALSVAILSVNTAVKIWTAAQTALNVVLTASPIGLVIAAVLVLVAAVVLAYRRSETFRAVVQAVWSAVKRAVSAAVSAIGGYLSAMWSALQTIISAVQAVWSAVRDAFNRIKAAATTLKNKLSWLKDAAVTLFGLWLAPIERVISGIGRIISAAQTAWDWIKKLNPFSGGSGGDPGDIVRAGRQVPQGRSTKSLNAFSGIAAGGQVMRSSSSSSSSVSIEVHVHDRTVAGMSARGRRELAEELAPELRRVLAVR